MLTSARKRRRSNLGLSLIEAMVTLSIAGVSMALAAPNFSNWLQNSRIRVSTEALVAGLQYAKSEATTRNSLVRYQLTTTLGSDCVISTSGSHWVVDTVDTTSADDSVEGRCQTAPSDTVQPGILQVRNASEGSGTTRVLASASAMTFNGLGRLTPTPNAAISIDVSNPTAGDCASDGGDLTCLRVQVSPAGQVRMCNPRFPAGDPQAC
jgi:type IV fimbrial biogenesis protein FimT